MQNKSYLNFKGIQMAEEIKIPWELEYERPAAKERLRDYKIGMLIIIIFIPICLYFHEYFGVFLFIIILFFMYIALNWMVSIYKKTYFKNYQKKKNYQEYLKLLEDFEQLLNSLKIEYKPNKYIKGYYSIPKINIRIYLLRLEISFETDKSSDRKEIIKLLNAIETNDGIGMNSFISERTHIDLKSSKSP
jgi:hypothetical protein